MKRAMGMAALCLLAAGSAGAAVVTFSAVPTQSGHTAGDGWWGNPSINYQPLSGGYTVGSITDGSNLGVTVDMTHFISDRGSDHTGDAPADYFLKGWTAASPWVMTFSQPVTISSFWQKGDYNSQASGATFAIYALAADSIPLKTVNVVNSGGGWLNVTGLDGYAGEKFALNLPNGNVLLDDMTVAVPEPAIFGVLMTGLAFMIGRRGRQHRSQS